MLQIDGSHGEGGGQILRSALAMSMVTDQPFTINNIRAGRKKPGLMRQHLTAVHAAMQVCNAQVQGDAIGSTALSFKPGKVCGGDYTFKIGTAGSTTLVFQTILPALMLAAQPSTITLHGGSHNPFAPPYDFLENVYLPLINTMGPTIITTLTKPGFFPAGGGAWDAKVQPVTLLKSVQLTDRGQQLSRQATAYVSNLPANIAQRELKVVRRKLNWSDEQLRVVEVTNAQGPGNILMLDVTFENIRELFTGFGENGRPSEAVANHAVQQYQRYLKSAAPVGVYLADQLLLPMALAGDGQMVCTELSRHATTQVDLIRKFLDVKIHTSDISDSKAVLVTINR